MSSNCTKRVLFLSALDFKDKSIQVIRKTPEAYVRQGWEVTYHVARDTTDRGDYYYEPVINPEGISVSRFEYPLKWLRNRLSRIPALAVAKLAGWLVILRLAWRGFRDARDPSGAALR